MLVDATQRELQVSLVRPGPARAHSHAARPLQRHAHGGQREQSSTDARVRAHR